MSKQDEYSVEPAKRERTGAFASLSGLNKGHSEYEILLLDALNKAGIPTQWGDAISTGADSSRVPDLLIPVRPGLDIVIEIMGAGSKSDSDKRHQELLRSGNFPLYFTNQQVRSNAELCVRQIRTTRTILRSLLP